MSLACVLESDTPSGCFLHSDMNVAIAKGRTNLASAYKCFLRMNQPMHDANSPLEGFCAGDHGLLINRSGGRGGWTEGKMARALNASLSR